MRDRRLPGLCRLLPGLLLLAAACAAEPGPDPLSPDGGGGGGGGPVACAGGCPDGSVCSEGACKVVPKSCPCPVESYCDLASSSCKVGCVQDGECSTGRYCDTAARTCRDGCRGDGECQSPEGGKSRCSAHSCTTTCNAGRHLCGSQCADSGSVASCGGACTPCATPPNASATCDGSACGLRCAEGFADCNGQAADGCEHAVTPVTCYKDGDGDGFGDRLVKQTFPCGACPTGWTQKADVFDCFDGNKDVFPGQTKYFCSAYGAGSYDYNCDGMVSKQEGQYAKSSGTCYITFPMSMGCGEMRSLPVCLPNNYETFTRCCR